MSGGGHVRRNAYVLMRDKKGWKSLARNLNNLNNTEYMRVARDLPEVDVPKGTLVEVDVEESFVRKSVGLQNSPLASSSSMTVVCMDVSREKVKLSVIFKELYPIEHELYELLFPLAPENRYSMVSDPDKLTFMKSCQVGETVICQQGTDASPSVGIIQWVGPIPIERGGKTSNYSCLNDLDRKGSRSGTKSNQGVWIGLELLNGWGDSDGQVNGVRYFKTEPYRAVFVTVDKISPYREYMNQETSSQHQRFDQDNLNERVKRLNLNSSSSSLPPFQNQNTQLTPSRGINTMPRQSTQISTRKTKGPSSCNANDAMPSVTPSTTGAPPIAIGERVVILTDEGPEYGTVRWVGRIASRWHAGVDFDKSIAGDNASDGVYQGQKLFNPRVKGHGDFVEMDCLLKASDFDHNNATAGDNEASSFSEGDHYISQSLAGSVENEVSWPHLPQSSGAGNVDEEDDDDDGATSPLGGPSTFEDSIGAALRDRNLLGSSLHTGGDPVSTRSGSLSRRNRNQSGSEREQEFFNAEAEVQTTGNEESELDQHPDEVRGGGEDTQNQQHKKTEYDQLYPDYSDPEVLRNLREVEVGSLVEVEQEGHNSNPLYGVVRWTGEMASVASAGARLACQTTGLTGLNPTSLVAGIEIEEEEIEGEGGYVNENQPHNPGVLLPFTHFRADRRFYSGGGGGQMSAASSDLANGNVSAAGSGHQDGGDDYFGSVECPSVTGFHPPIRTDDTVLLWGRNKGIQGHQNSCYLDATLFAMFSFTSIFDCLLYRPANTQDISEYGEVQRVLREDIVNPLRKNQFVRADKVMKLRQFLDTLTSVKGLMSEEKDPEELLNSLLSQTLKATPFLELSPSDQTAHLYQLFVERDDSRRAPPTVQELLEQSFLTSGGIKLKKVPPALILQMPRFGRQFKVYDKILPSQLLDVTDVIEDSPRQCIICGKLASFECLSCFGDHGSGLDSTAFCDGCHERVHAHAKRRDHKPNPLNVPPEFEHHPNPTTPRLFMELFAVLCIETSHYVTFAKCGSGPDSPWCFFDSMADRKGEQNGYNIPEVTLATDVTRWFADGAPTPSKGGMIATSDQVKRMVSDAYMCFYQSTEVMMYQ